MAAGVISPAVANRWTRLGVTSRSSRFSNSSASSTSSGFVWLHSGRHAAAIRYVGGTFELVRVKDIPTGWQLTKCIQLPTLFKSMCGQKHCILRCSTCSTCGTFPVHVLCALCY